jgi:hypothetical protein
MRILYSLIFLMILMGGCQSSYKNTSTSFTEETQPNYAALQKELEEIYDIDQGIRNIDWDTISTPEASIAYSMKMIAIDSVNQTRVIPILERYGWLPKSLIGEKAASAIFLVVQHSGSKTIEKYLPQMEALATKGEASATGAAMMRDRLLSFQGKKQIYGTQSSNTVRGDGSIVIWPIEDSENVNRRRKKVGFTTTVEENAKRLGAEYDPNEELPKKYNTTQK